MKHIFSPSSQLEAAELIFLDFGCPFFGLEELSETYPESALFLIVSIASGGAGCEWCV
jgi:hypothetical protein